MKNGGKRQHYYPEFTIYGLRIGFLGTKMAFEEDKLPEESF
jgi:hypothetical protein